MDERQFLKNYNASEYERPSVTADIVIFTLDGANKLSILLIKRGGHPFKDHWALPGGFLNAGKESVDDAAKRELLEETGIEGAYLKQLATFSRPDRDPRTHVVSVAYTALIPKGKLTFQAGDDAKEADVFQIQYNEDELKLIGNGKTLAEADLAFDHAEIIKTAIIRLKNRIHYEPDAFELLEDKYGFTIYELKTVYEAIECKRRDNPNFRKLFGRRYLETGFVIDLEKTKAGKGHKPAALYRVKVD